MAKIEKIHIEYQSNYNGCSLTANEDFDMTYGADDATVHAKARKCGDAITKHAYEECNRHGEFCGDIDELEEFATKIVREEFGDDVVITFEEDDMST